MIAVNGLPLKLSTAHGTGGDDAILSAWTFGVHDHSLAAWVIVAAYVVAIGCCVAAWRRDAAHAAGPPADGPRAHAPWFWVVVASFLFLLAINKPLDLHNLFTDFGRYLAHSGGWYEHRRRVQLAFV